MPETPLQAQVGLPPVGRRFTGRRKVRLGDVTPSGRLRLDALTRYTQDVSDDDTTEAGLPAEPGWVVRSTVVDVLASATLAETITLTTFCSGLGRRWAERRLQIRGDGGAHYEVSTLWICVDTATGRPVALSDEFHELYGPAAGGRKVTARLVNPKPPPETSPETPTEIQPWPLRAVDFDTLDHMNNAAYWAVVEEHLAADPATEPFRARLEYAAGLAAGQVVTVASGSTAAGHLLWWLTAEGEGPAASASLTPLPPDLYDR